MRIGILTFHDGYNYGAFLQALALQEYFKSYGDLDVEIINYKKLKFLLKENIHYLKKDGRIISNLNKIKKFKRAHSYFNLSNYFYSNNKIENYYDKVFFGSDEVWNINNPAFGYDLTYFGNGFENSELYSYAPSFGSTSINDFKLKLVKPLLSKFTNISVRDYNSRNIIQNLLGYEPEIVPDPTFILNVNKWVSDLNKPSYNEYILVYASKLTINDVKFIIDYANKEKKLLISVGYYYNWCDKNIINIGPFEWMNFIKHSSFVFTSMFHGTIFSLLFNRPFVVFMDPYRKNKFSFLIDYLNINSYIYNDVSFYISEHYNWENINKNINSLEMKGINYLKRCLNS